MSALPMGDINVDDILHAKDDTATNCWGLGGGGRDWWSHEAHSSPAFRGGGTSPAQEAGGGFDWGSYETGPAPVFGGGGRDWGSYETGPAPVFGGGGRDWGSYETGGGIGDMIRGAMGAIGGAARAAGTASTATAAAAGLPDFFSMF